MPKLIHIEDLLGSLVHDVFQRRITKHQFEKSITLPEGFLWEDFWKEYARLMHKYEDCSHCRIIGAVTRDLMKKFWEAPKMERQEAA